MEPFPNSSGVDLAGQVLGPCETLRWPFFNLICLLGIMTAASGLAVAQPSTPASNSITFEAFLQHQPIIPELVYQRVSAGGQHEENYILQVDGENSSIKPIDSGSLTINGMATGRFRSSFWHYYPGNKTLVIVDSHMNAEVKLPHFPLPPELRGKPIEDGGANGEMEHNMLKRQVWEVMNLGFPEIDRDRGFVFDKEQSRILGFASVFWGLPHVDEGHPVEIRLRYTNGVPMSAIFRDAAYGNSGILVTYKYSDAFYGGRLPIEFTRFAMSPTVGDGHETPEFTIRFRNLQVSDESLTDTVLDPRATFKPMQMGVIIWSNNVPYSTIRNVMRPVLTAEEGAIRNQNIRARRHAAALRASRWMLAFFVGGSAICMTLVFIQKRKSKR